MTDTDAATAAPDLYLVVIRDADGPPVVIAYAGGRDLAEEMVGRERQVPRRAAWVETATEREVRTRLADDRYAAQAARRDGEQRILAARAVATAPAGASIRLRVLTSRSTIRVEFGPHRIQPEAFEFDRSHSLHVTEDVRNAVRVALDQFARACRAMHQPDPFWASVDVSIAVRPHALRRGEHVAVVAAIPPTGQWIK